MFLNHQQCAVIKSNGGKRPFAKQRGFVLVITLILLAVLTLIGVSSMNNANTELKATANARQQNIAFNAVQSIIAFAVSGETNLNFQNTQAQTVTVASVAGALTKSANLSGDSTHAGCSVGVGSSLEAGKGFSFNFFEIIASGSNASGTATSIQGQGVRFPAAACN